MRAFIESNSRKEMVVKIFDALFGCWHKRISFPQTSKRGQRRCEAAMHTGTYVVCLECGAEFPYDWKLRRAKESGRGGGHETGILGQDS